LRPQPEQGSQSASRPCAAASGNLGHSEISRFLAEFADPDPLRLALPLVIDE
jgi:hypothetical protein